MNGFNLFLEFVALILSISSLGLIYIAIRECSESQFVPIYYFLALSSGGVAVLSLARIEAMFWGNGFVVSSALLQDLFISYIALFLFGSLWQSYEAEMCVPRFVDSD
ncbi:MAG: hypothetical protein ABEJ07_00925 [Candidatus Nanohaloarchaea archaeon]